MKKKFLCALLSVAMIATMLAGCGKKDDDKATTADPTQAPAATEDTTETTDPTEAPKAEVTDITPDNEGKVLNIWCWNTDVQTGAFKFYPGYVDNGDGTGKIDDVTVNWVVTPNQDNAYQNALDAALLEQANASADDKIDIFLIEADYALKYTNAETPVALSMDEVGLTADDMKDQYQYTKDIVTDGKGVIRGTTFQACPGLYAYRRSIAKDVLGTDDPDQVQAKISNWDDFNAVAAQMKAKGYTMLSGYDDSFRVFSNNMAGAWVQNGKVVVDDNLLKWADQTKEFTDKGYNNKTSLWNDGWVHDQGPDGKTFGYFYSTWGINFTLKGNSRKDTNVDAAPGNGIYGDWAVCYGPAAYAWGGTWFCAAAGTDNTTLVRDIMYKLTCDKDVMKTITEETQDYTNNITAMEEIANSDFTFDFLGGQNHIKLFAEAAKKISMKNMSPYDQGCTEEFQSAMKDYFDGVVTKEEALENFYTNILVKYPELSR